MAEKRLPVLNILITSGLAAAIGAFGAGAAELIKERRAIEMQRCELAAQLLEDETPNAGLDEGRRRHDVELASHRFELCMEGGR
ncbi:hypothetical protein [Sphingomonas bacterium]|uniref:hypothetical protein n=1 Tax=Sphingomonas bacterium TaxID=1895847 RepID=UPI001576F6D9|nr:hypothetical protein [Sphingomonas bacterium]